MALNVEEFIRRFLPHVLPVGFTRIRHYGLLANRGHAGKLACCRALLDVSAPAPVEPETVAAFWLRITGVDIHRCPLLSPRPAAPCHDATARAMRS